MKIEAIPSLGAVHRPNGRPFSLRRSLLKRLGKKRWRIFRDDAERRRHNDARLAWAAPYWIVSSFTVAAIIIAMHASSNVHGGKGARLAIELGLTELAVAAFWSFIVWLRHAPKDSIQSSPGK